jgi:polyphosphate kinase
MQRNLEKRVEVLCPVEDPRLQAELRVILDTQLSDQRGAWDMQPDGSYVQRTGLNAKHSQQQMIERTERRLKEATRLRRRKVQAGTRRKRG